MKVPVSAEHPGLIAAIWRAGHEPLIIPAPIPAPPPPTPKVKP